jgi:hypothetical protein
MATNNPVVCRVVVSWSGSGPILCYPVVIGDPAGPEFSAEVCGGPVQLSGDGEFERKQDYATDS